VIRTPSEPSTPKVLSELLARFPEVHEDGRDGYVVPCPSHNDGHPSLRIALDAETGSLLLKCRAGCAFSDVAQALGLGDLKGWTPGDAIRTTHRTELSVGPAEVAALRVYLSRAEELLPGSEAERYALDRFGVDPELAAHLGLGYDPGTLALGDGLLSRAYSSVPRLVVPFRGFDGVARAVQGRALASHRVRWCGASNPPSGASWATVAVFDAGTGLDTVVVTEGPGDALTVAAAGFNSAAVRGAALSGPATTELVSGLRGRRAVIIGDNDDAGRAFAADLSALLAREGILAAVASVPEGINDLTDWRAADPEAFHEALEATVEAARPVARPSAPAARPAPTAGPEDDDAEQTDLGNAERLRDALRGLVRHSPEAGFFLWTGSHWTLDRYDAVRTAAQDVARALVSDGLEAYNKAADDEARKAAKDLMSWGKRSQSTRAIDAMVRELSALEGVAVDIERMDAHHHLLAFRNGTVDLRTGELKPHDPKLLLTRCMDMDYDPAASCPRWEAFLAEVFPSHPDLVPYMGRLVGYGISGETAEQCFAVLLGRGANGKSVLTDTLTAVFRQITTTTPFSTFEERPSGGIPNDLAAMKGARLVMASEGAQGKPMNESVIKRLTGRDLVSARFMRREFFEFRPTFLILLATNHRPTFKGQDEGLWRRVKLIPFDRYFAPDERDHTLGDALLREAPGIAAWAVRGAVEWYARGLQDPPSVKAATADFRGTSDQLDSFYPGVLEDAPGSVVIAAEVHHAYVEWAEREGLSDRETWTRRTLYAALEERGVRRVRRAEGQTLLDVRLRTSTPGAPVIGCDSNRPPSIFDPQE
jgi:putative DNA primase/helicase